MNKVKITVLIITLFGLIFACYGVWFNTGVISGGDAPFYFFDQAKKWSWMPELWSNDGLGYFNSLLYSIPYLFLFPKILLSLGINWEITERLVWYFPFIVLSSVSVLILASKIKFSKPMCLLAILIYLFNTYSLMIVAGGQVSVLLAYSIFPLVIACFIVSYQKPSVRNLLQVGLILCIIFSFEPRFAGLCFLVSSFFSITLYGLKIKDLFINMFVIAIILIGINFYWFLPALLFRNQAYSPSLTGGDWLSFLSLANFSNSFSLLHPLWPENIFGKTYLMRPEFLVLPISVFLSLLLINVKKFNNLLSDQEKKIYLIGLLLVIIGAFLSKGVNPPFGNIYRFLYSLPFFNTFRDPVKFYFIIAIGYLIAVPIIINFYKKITQTVWPRMKFIFPLLLIFFLGYWIILLKPSLTGQLNGTFKIKSIPVEYSRLENFLVNQNQFFRTLWIPGRQRFGFISNIHPAINSDIFVSPGVCQKSFCDNQIILDTKWIDICNSTNRCYVSDISYFENPETENALRQMSVKYIVVPTDSQQELFINERCYSDLQRNKVIEFLDTIKWLNTVEQFSDLKVYEVGNPRDLFYTDTNINIDWKMVSTTRYELNFTGDRVNKIYFSQSYNPGWQLVIDNKIYHSIKEEELMGFEVNQTGDFTASLEFVPQRYVFPGVIVSLLTLFGCIGFLVVENIFKIFSPRVYPESFEELEE